jgi:hypothetical protein
MCGSAPYASRNARAAPYSVEPQEPMPAEPPGTCEYGAAVSPISSAICSTATPRASAATWVSAVHVPVPMSIAPMRTA